MATSGRQNNLGAAMLIVGILAALGIVFYLFPPWEVATDGPDKARHAGMTTVPVALWWVGSGLLAIALYYGIIRTRNRSQNERVRSEEATRRLYDDENRDEKKEGLS
jgi:hypothetical protein